MDACKHLPKNRATDVKRVAQCVLTLANRIMIIKSLTKTSFDTIYKAFSQAFADYELQPNRDELQAMLKRRRFDPNLSFAAFDGDDIVAFTLNGIGVFNGVPTAYDTGTGTLKDYRGRGLATKIFEHSIPYLKEAKIEQYLLEVLQHNTKAVSVYRNLGFETTREFYYFIQKNEDVHNNIENIDPAYSIKSIEIEKLDSIMNFWDFHPSWQNNLESIQSVRENVVSLGVFIGQELVGYCVFEPASGDVTQIAVEKHHRRKGIASLLLSEIIKLNKKDAIKIVNTDILCSPITHFLNVKNIAATGKQFEMIKKI